ncbi:fasciclin domain-containing protein [Flavisolibacter sp. BT320]|nr:fasciclin domain-containing protein [Flavisolibacter longurius]
MKINFHKFLSQFMLSAAFFSLLTACNKDVPDPVPVEPEAPSTAVTIGEMINTDASFSLLKTAINRVPGLLEMLSDKDAVYTVFAPDDAAFQRSGINATVINALPAQQIAAIMQYHVVGGQRLNSTMIPTAFPNIQLPTQLVLAPPSTTLPPGLRMSIFPFRNGNTGWVNNIPLTATDVQAANGVIHKVAAIVLPPQQMLWERIAADSELDYLEAAVRRADQATPSPGLVAALSNPAASLTVFAPNDNAFSQLLTLQITGALVAQGVPAANAQAAATALVTTYGTTIISNPASIPDAPIFPAGTGIGAQLAAILTPTTVQGIVVYHLLGSRAFSVNLPTTATARPTLLNSGIANHPGVTLQATFGPTGVTAATVKGVGNQSASAIQVNPTTAPGGTSDQHYVNGVLHIINQVLLPQ